MSASLSPSDRKPFLVGNSNIMTFINEHAFFIDKTPLANAFINSPFEAICILRPRRFGKTFGLSIIKSLLIEGANKKDFVNCRVFQDNGFMSKHFGKYPVLSVSFSTACRSSLEELCGLLQFQICEALSADNITEDSITSTLDKQYFRSLYTCSLSVSQFILTLRWATKMMSLRHEGKKVILLIDEYDYPMRESILGGFGKEASNVFKEFYHFAVKDNPYLKKALFVGILKYNNYDILSGMNNVYESSLYDSLFAEFFGFTMDELRVAIPDKEERDRAIRQYNGYEFGGITMVNPYSVCQYLASGNLDNFWTRTNAVLGLREILKENFSQIVGALYPTLFCQSENAIHIDNIQIDVPYGGSYNERSFINFLIATGYLTFHVESKVDGEISGNVSIPNREVRYAWKTDLQPILQSDEYGGNILLHALGNDKFDSNGKFCKDDLLKAIFVLMDIVSFFDIGNEQAYHAFFNGALSVSSQKRIADVSSNRESGFGRYDIAVCFKDRNRVFIFEFKVLKGRKGEHEQNICKTQEKLRKLASEALEQIHLNQYYSKFEGMEVVNIGVAFKGKFFEMEVDQERKTRTSYTLHY